MLDAAVKCGERLFLGPFTPPLRFIVSETVR
jgi:hypothetical protein